MCTRLPVRLIVYSDTLQNKVQDQCEVNIASVRLRRRPAPSRKRFSAALATRGRVYVASSATWAFPSPTPPSNIHTTAAKMAASSKTEQTNAEKEKALLTELMGFTPMALMDDIINTVNEVTFQAVNAVEVGINRAAPEELGFRLDEKEAAKLRTAEARQEALQQKKQDEADNGVVALESLLNATIDKTFDKFEIYSLRNILTVGDEKDPDLVDYVTLDHYKNLDFAAATNAPTEAEVEAQRRRLEETTKLNISLKAKEAEQEEVLKQVKEVQEKLRFLKSGASPEDVQYLKNQISTLLAKQRG
jgi:hypothetical protein